MKNEVVNSKGFIRLFIMVLLIWSCENMLVGVKEV